MRKISPIALVCLICLCILIVPAAQARTWHVPSDVLTVTEAIALAESGDVIELAVGVHKITGREHVLKPGLIIRSDTGMPGGVVLKECACYCGDWRDRPVFVVDRAGDPVRFEGLRFKDFTLSCGPFPTIGNPIFHVTDGSVKFTDCRFENLWKTAVWFDGGVGHFRGCTFENGCGCAGAIHFDGQRLFLTDCRFEQFHWLNDGQELAGNILQLVSGEIELNRVIFADNGPLIELVTVGADAELNAYSSCFVDNATMWEGVVAGRAVLDCCSIDPVLWNVVDGGELMIIGDDTKAATIEQTTLSAVKSLFR